jgi:ubiquitin C-terminal hydrolase
MTSNQVPTSVVEFKKAIVLNSPFQDFANSHQQDSHQFLITLLQSISDEFASHHQDSIPFWFRSTLLSRVQCQTCRRVSTNEGDHSTSIEVEIFGNSLEDCLMNFFQHEVIDNQWICDHCNIERRAFKYLLLQERPILIITLKRFTGESQKISTNVKFPIDNLSVPNLVNERNEECNTTRYNLFAVVNHLGVSSTSGHYTLYMRDDKKWLKFDDENVVQIRKERVISSNAYTLVYIQKEKYKILGS